MKLGEYEEISYGTFPSTESFTKPDGTIGGYSALFCDWMSQLFGIEFTPETMEDPGFKINLAFSFNYGSYLGFNKDETLLKSIVSKAQAYVDTDIIAERWKQRIFDYSGTMARQQTIFLLGFSVMLIAIIALLSIVISRRKRTNIILERTVRERTAALEIQTVSACCRCLRICFPTL